MANKKITELPEILTPTLTDLVPIVKVAPVPYTGYTTLDNVFKLGTSADGWNADPDTWTYQSASTFKVPGNKTSVFAKGTHLRWTQTTVKYGVVLSSSYSSPDTTVTIVVNTNYVITNAAISLNYISRIDLPLGFPEWFNYVPAYSASGSMTFASVTTSFARYCIKGRTAFATLRATGTTGGTASDSLRATLPVEALQSTLYPTAVGTVVDGGGTLSGGLFISDGTPDFVNARKYDSSNFGLGAGRIISFIAIYEI